MNASGADGILQRGSNVLLAYNIGKSQGPPLSRSNEETLLVDHDHCKNSKMLESEG